jgi:N-acetylneuraminic acid mutarotase
MMRKIRQLLVLAALLPLAGVAGQPPIPAQRLPDLPRPISNNAATALATEDGVALFSFLGLESGKQWRDTSAAAFMLAAGASSWRELPDVPGGEGRLASSAAAVGGRIYVFGGYTVAADGSEISTPFVHAFDPRSGKYLARKPIPVPVDDTVALVSGNRFVYLVSGWHDNGNINLVQFYDTVDDRWSQATPYPGQPVFGHAGGIAGTTIVICDGVAIEVSETARRRFTPSAECYRGEIDGADRRRIEWFRLAPHPGAARYRMAATGVPGSGGWVVFAGGTDNPYNYDGIGYDGQPAEPDSDIFGYSIAARTWRRLGRLEVATMDHRALLAVDNRFVVVGGMRSGQRVSDTVLAFQVELP